MVLESRCDMEEQITKLLEKLNSLVDVIPQVYEVVRKQYVIHNILREIIGALILCTICVGGVIVLYWIREANMSKQLRGKSLGTVELETIDGKVHYYINHTVDGEHFKLYVTEDEQGFQFYTRDEDGRFIEYEDEVTLRLVGDELMRDGWLGYISNREIHTDFKDDYDEAKDYNTQQTQYKRVRRTLVILTCVLISLVILGIGLFIADACLAPDINFLEYLGGIDK